MSKPFTLTSDSSGFSLAYILSQEINGEDHPIAYGGRALRDAETRYTVSEQELLALVEGIKANHTYLSHKPFNVYTDHRALQWLHNIKHLTPRLSRGALLLQEYQFTVHYRKGSQLGNADGLSRRVYNEPLGSQPIPEIDEKVALSLDMQDRSPLYKTEIIYTHDAVESAPMQPVVASLQNMCLKSGQFC